MKKIFTILVLAIAMLTGCVKQSDTQLASKAIDTTKNDIIGSWTSDDGEVYTFDEGYIFSGTLMVGDALKEVSGDFNLVSIDGSDTTLTINTPDARVTYYVDIHGSEVILSDTDTKEEVKTLKLTE